MHRGKLLINARRGSVLPLIIMAVVLMVTVGVGVLGLGFHSRMLAVRSGAEIASRCAADAAVASAVFQMNEKLKVKPWDYSWLPTASNVGLLNCDAGFDYTVSENAGVYTIHGTGRAGHSVHSVEGTLRVYSVFDYALFARDSLELKNSATIDWINNEPGDWPLQVGTNSTSSGAITLKNGSHVKGDAVVGVGGNPDDVISGIENVEGSAYAMFSKAVLPSVTVPDWLAAMSSGGDITDSTPPIGGSGKYNKINLKKGELIITAPVVLYITENIDLGNGAKISIDNDASLIIYLAGNLTGSNSAGFNNITKDAKRLTVYGLDLCVDVRLKNGSDFYGSIYAPNASIIFDNSNTTYGSIVGQNLILKNGAFFYYDAALRDRTVNDDAVRFVIQRWSEQ